MGPQEWNILSFEIIEGFRNSGIIGDEASVEICKSGEGLYIADVLGCWPLRNSLDLDWVCSNVLWGDHIS